MLRKKNITLNGKKATGSEKLVSGDEIKLFLSDETYDKFAGTDTVVKEQQETYRALERLAKKQSYKCIPVIYEDEHIAVLNKPAGMLSQKANPSDISANELFLAYLIDTNQLTDKQFETVKPSVCNRLDCNTSGLILCGKTIHGLQMLSKALQDRTMKKYYICLVKGVIKEPITVEGYLKKDEQTNKVRIEKEAFEDAKYIKTAYEPLSNNGKYTRLKVHLITGRSHQIRAHLAYLGHPLLGDFKYGDKTLNNYIKKEFGVNYQMLHAYEILFDNGLHLFAPIPQLFDTIEGETNETGTCSSRRNSME